MGKIDQLASNLIENLIEGCQIISPDYQYLYVNSAAAKHGLTTREALIGRKMPEMYPGIESTPMFSVLRGCMEQRTRARMENEFSYPDGRRGWFELRFEPVPEGLAILSEDITNRKLAEAALRSSESQLRAIFEFASVGIVQVDAQTGVILRWNEKFREMMGYANEEMGAMTFSALTHPEDRDRDWELFSLACKNKAPSYHTEKRYLRKDGVVIWGRVHVAFIRDEAGDTVRTVSVCEDITKYKEIEEASRRAEIDRMGRLLAEANYEKLRALELMRDGLVHMIVHDMRSLVASQILSLSLLQSEMASGLSAQNATDLEHAIESGTRLSRMMSDVVDVSKLEAGNMPLERGMHDVAALIQTAIQNTQPIANKKVYVVQAEPARVFCDGNIILRVIENLINNGLRHAPNSKNIELSLQVTSGYARVSIHDDGPGIAPQYHNKIFEKFGALQIPKTSYGSSTGLGLAFCKLAVEAHGGQINVESQLGQGCTFHFRLPMAA